MAKSDDEATLTVPLTVQERAERAEIMAGLVHQIRAVKAQAKAKAFEFKGQVDALMERLEEHARVISEGVEDQRQMDLFADGTKDGEALRAAASGIAERCTCEGGPDADVKDPACPVHGVAAAAPAGDLEADDDESDEALVEAAAAIGEQVDVGTVEEPQAVAEHRAQRARARRSSGDAA